MTLYAKTIFFITILLVYSLTYIFEKNNSTRAIQKILIFSILLMMIVVIIAPSFFVLNSANILGVGRGPDAVLYLYIIFSFAINFILFRKISELEILLSKLSKKIALNDIKDKSFTKKNK
tara:strand:+ start:4380 stop:4739 length:360 start_codon:yes stop_codon:yes gene_type:complete